MTTPNRFISTMLLAVVLSSVAFGQVATVASDSLVDVFPLAVGNEWIYRYFTSSLWWPAGNPGTTTTDSGRVRMLVSGAVVGPDSTSWELQVQRELVHHVVFAYLGSPERDTAYAIRDSSTFILIERLDDQHRLYRNDDPSRIRMDVIPFTRGYVDTTSIWRYRPVGSGDTTRIQSWIDSPGAPPFMSRFTFKRGVGLIRNSYNSGTLDVSSENDHYLLSATITGLHPNEVSVLPSSVFLSQNFPNPFNPTTSIQYVLPRSMRISLRVFDILGCQVTVLADGVETGGQHAISWDASNCSTGIYFVKLQTDQAILTRKMLLVR